MRNNDLPRTILVAVLSALLSAPPVVAAGAPADPPNAGERFRDELVQFFAHSRELSPTALGALENDPAALKQIRAKIEALSPEEISAMEMIFSQVPEWQGVPEALASAFQMEVLADQASRQARDLDAFRTDIAELYTALEMLPPGLLEKLNQDRASIADMHRRLQEMSPQSLALAQLQINRQADLRTLNANLFSTLTPEARAGMRALATEGPLGAEELRDLSAFKKDLLEFFDGLKRLPEGVAAGLDRASIDALEARLGMATPEMLFLIKQKSDSAELRQTMSDVRLLADARSLTDVQVADLEKFRSDLGGIYAALGDSTGSGGAPNDVMERLAGLSREELLLARERVERIPGWRQTLPVILGAASSPEARLELAVMTRSGADAVQRQTLEAFRTRSVDRLASLRDDPRVEPAAAARALRSLRQASSEELFLMKGAEALLSPDDLLGAVNLPAAIALLTAPRPESVSFNCSCPDHGIDLPLGIGCISLQFLCNIIAAPINLALSGIELAVGGLQTVVNGITSVIDDVFNFVKEIPRIFTDLPDILLGALQSLFRTIAEAALGAFSPANIAAALNLTGEFWASIPVLPQIPCPPDGFNLHPFGEVGEDTTASKYERYLFIFDKVLEIIPDTEVSLTLKVPAQILYGGIEYLGVCLQDAAMARSDAATDTFRSSVLANQVDLGQGIGLVQTGVGIVQAQVMDLRAQLLLQGEDLTGLIRTQVDRLNDTILQFEELELRLKIEDNLTQGGDREIAFFQLPRAVGGVLETVREIVQETIQQALDAGLRVHNAEAELRKGDAAFAAGDYRAAYERYARAYRAAVNGGDDD